jgi:hypothetical protein
MGGHGSGGLRPGSGRKPDEQLSDVQPVDMPTDLSESEQKAWQELAPKASARGTLTPETADRFRLLCRAVSFERSMAARLEKDGWVYIAVTVDGAGQEREVLKAHPLCGPHRGMMQRVEAGMVAFRIAPTGKQMVTVQEKPKSALEKLQARKLRAV